MQAYYAYQNDLIVLLNVRSALSLIGIVLIVVSTWLWERKWDEEGTQNTTTSTEPNEPSSVKETADYEKMEAQGSDDADKAEKETEKPEVFKMNDDAVKDLKEVLAFPTETSSNVQPFIKLSLVGWVLLALSYLAPRKAWYGFDFSFLGLASMILICCLGYIQAVVIPKLIVRKDFTRRKDLWNMIMVFGMFLQGIFAFLLDTHAPVFAAPIGGLCIAMSPMIMWSSRALGDTFDSEARANPNPILFNFGGPLLVFGWFWFWIGMNTCYYVPSEWMPYIHVYAGIRMGFAFVGAFFALCTTWFVGYAFDEVVNMSGKPDTPEILEEASAFGCGGYFCGYAYEIKVATIMSWAFLGIAMFFPYMWHDPSDWFFLAASVGLGYCSAMIHEDGLRNLSNHNITMWSKRSWAFLTVMAIIIPIQQGGHYLAIILSAGGAFMYAYGIEQLLEDSKRGRKWAETAEVQNPKVYSFGALLTPLGLLVLAWAVSMHAN